MNVFLNFLFVGLPIFFIIGLMLNIKYLVKSFFSFPREIKLVFFSWFFLFFGLAVWINRGSGIDILSYSIQVVSIMFISLITFYFILKNKKLFLTKFLLFYLVYGFIGLLTSFVSTKPFITLFKAYSLIIVIIFTGFIIKIIKYNKKYRFILVETSIIYFIFIVFLSLLGGYVFPEITHRHNNGPLGFMLVGWPKLNSNTLSFLAAVVSSYGLIRYVFSKKIKIKMLYFSIFLMGLSVLFLAQGRTSIISFTLGILLISFLLGELKKIRYFIFIVLIIGISYYAIKGNININNFDLLFEYLSRGSTVEQLETISGRTELWEMAIEKVQKSPFIGYGFYVTTVYGPYGPHNSMLQVLLYSGFIGLLFWLVSIFIGYYKIFNALFLVNKIKYVSYKDYENLLMIWLFIIITLLRTITGSDLTVHHYSTLFFLSLYVYAYVLLNWIKKGKG